MEIKLQLEGQEADEGNLLALQDWLKRSEIQGLNVERDKSRPAEGEMGDVSAVLSVALGSAAVVEMVRALHTWIKTRRRNVSIKIKLDGKEVEINAENLASDEAITHTAEKLIKATK
jgi:Effector Associated Constant Component 1